MNALVLPPAQRVPRAYYARRLLEHGPLTTTEFREITRWPALTCAVTLFRMVEEGIAEKTPIAGSRRYEWRLA